MAFIVADRVKESTTTVGTGPITLAGTSAGFQAFSAALAINDTTYYAIVGQGTNEWEVGLGTLTGATTLARTTVYASTNANALVNFSAGIKEVFLTYPAKRSVNKAHTLRYLQPRSRY